MGKHPGEASTATTGGTQQQCIQCDYPFEGYSTVRMLFRQGSSYIGTMTDSNRRVRMYRHPNLQFALNQTIFWDPEERLSDIVLPVCTNLERWDIGEWARISGYSLHLAPTNARVICLQQKCIEPLGESKSDYAIYTMMADRLGMKESYTEGRDELGWCGRMYEISDLPKVTIWEEFMKKSYYIVPVPEDYKPTDVRAMAFQKLPGNGPEHLPGSGRKMARR